MARQTTAVDAVAERYLEVSAALDPCAATEFGIAGYDDEITDYSPDGVAARVDAATSDAEAPVVTERKRPRFAYRPQLLVVDGGASPALRAQQG